MSLLAIPSRDYRIMPWRNGKGETVEIARAPAGGAGLDDFDWRLSLAPVVADGAFSVFPGIERTIVVVEGAGMELSLPDDLTHRLLPAEPFSYDGGLQVHGRLLSGPVRDLNLMTRRATHRGTLLLADGRLALSIRSGTLLAHALSGDWDCGGTILTAGASLRIEDAGGRAFAPLSSSPRLALALITAI